MWVTRRASELARERERERYGSIHFDCVKQDRRSNQPGLKTCPYYWTAAPWEQLAVLALERPSSHKHPLARRDPFKAH